jgi:hypothetical protein
LPFRVRDLRLEVRGSRFGVQGSGLEVRGFGLQASKSEGRSSGFGVRGSKFEVWAYRIGLARVGQDVTLEVFIRQKLGRRVGHDAYAVCAVPLEHPYIRFNV